MCPRSERRRAGRRAAACGVAEVGTDRGVAAGWTCCSKRPSGACHARQQACKTHATPSPAACSSKGLGDRPASGCRPAARSRLKSRERECQERGRRRSCWRENEQSSCGCTTRCAHRIGLSTLAVCSLRAPSESAAAGARRSSRRGGRAGSIVMRSGRAGVTVRGATAYEGAA